MLININQSHGYTGAKLADRGRSIIPVELPKDIEDSKLEDREELELGLLVLLEVDIDWLLELTLDSSSTAATVAMPVAPPIGS